MKTIASIISLLIFLVGIAVSIDSYRRFNERDAVRIELEAIQKKYGSCFWVPDKNGKIDIFTGRVKEIEVCPHPWLDGYSLDKATYGAKSAKEEIYVGFVIALAGPIAVFLAYLLLMKIFRKTKSAVINHMPVIRKQVDDVREGIRESQVKKIVEKATLDEAARITTRAAMTVFNEKEIMVLQKQIHDALAKGDYETAQALMSTLRKIEGK